MSVINRLQMFRVVVHQHVSKAKREAVVPAISPATIRGPPDTTSGEGFHDGVAIKIVSLNKTAALCAGLQHPCSGRAEVLKIGAGDLNRKYSSLEA
jgi:hypothetical protein